MAYKAQPRNPRNNGVPIPGVLPALPRSESLVNAL